MNGGPVLPGSLSLIEARYRPVSYSYWRPGAAQFFMIRPGTARFFIINKTPVLPGFLVVNEARYCPVSYH